MARSPVAYRVRGMYVKFLTLHYYSKLNSQSSRDYHFSRHKHQSRYSTGIIPGSRRRDWLRHIIPGLKRVRTQSSATRESYSMILPRYDRYWMGRTSWSDIVKTSRTLSRLIWIHAPLTVDKKVKPDDPTNAERGMQEKLLALDMIEG